MKNPRKQIFSKADQQRIEACVTAAEARTRGEIVVLVVPSSYHYPMAAVLGSATFALPVALALTPVFGGFFWAGPNNVWIFLAVLLPLLLCFHETIRRISRLKRCFIRSDEMEAEVREAAHIQFFRKGLYRTAEETGVLFYVSIFERRVWVIGDRGINARIPERYWEHAAAGIAQAIHAGRAAEGICRAITEVAAVLEQNFPASSDDTNELKNLMLEGGPT